MLEAGLNIDVQVHPGLECYVDGQNSLDPIVHKEDKQAFTSKETWYDSQARMLIG